MCCVCDPSVGLGVLPPPPFVSSVCLYEVCEFISEIEGSLAFCALMLFLYSILCACGVYLAFWDVVFACMENDVCVDGVFSVYIWCWLNVRESSLGVCGKLYQVCIPIVRECASVLM